MQTEKISATQFEELFRKNYTRFYYYAYDILNQEEESRDVVAEAFMSVWKNLENIDHEKLQSYLFTSVRNKCLTLLSRQRTTCRLSDDMLHVIAAETESEWLEREERIRRIEQEIDSLPHPLCPGTMLLPPPHLPRSGQRTGHHHRRNQKAHYHRAEASSRTI